MNIEISQDEQNINISGDVSTYHLPVASSTTLGGVKVGNNLSITSDGVLSAAEYQLSTATAAVLGGVKVGSGLTISDGSLSVNVDSVLSSSSTNPLQNKVIYSNLNSISSDISGLDTRLDNAEDAIVDNAEDISSLSGDFDTLSGTVTDLGDTVSGFSSDIEGNTTNIGLLDGRLDTAEEDIDNLQGDVSDINTALTDVTNIVEATIEYTELLPAATWTSGQLDLHRRGLLGFLFMNLEGSFLLGANSSTTIYTFQTPSNIPLYTTSATVLTDVGNIVLEVTDQGEVNLSNPSASALTISKIYGNVPLVY